ncbi:SDR family oxidoreductase [Halioxenophilus sp. WMMB6]|uniref:SDR family NAD(P)-dependent oxidoreductase n=1 Tax=Halioxenophilus sp. WMMB6 TaxID=3073815 RepID=UPI00295F21F5|nr:SDR family oxidoreductase [Halioxenophilus sp. WMMB6]
MLKSHAGRVAVVTGAAGALGREFALALAAHGCDVAIADIAEAHHVVAEIEALGQRGYSEVCDLSDPIQIESFVTATLQKFGRCDILVNNAAYMPVIPFAELDLNQLRRFQAINVDAAFLLAKLLTPGMVDRGYGRIVQIASSTTGTPMPGFLAYITTKMAGIGLTRSLAAEFGDRGILCNALSPGLTLTPESKKNLPPELFESVCERQLIKRNELPSDLVGALLFLTSEGCGFVSGQTINCDGGVQF